MVKRYSFRDHLRTVIFGVFKGKVISVFLQQRGQEEFAHDLFKDFKVHEYKGVLVSFDEVTFQVADEGGNVHHFFIFDVGFVMSDGENFCNITVCEK